MSSARTAGTSPSTSDRTAPPSCTSSSSARSPTRRIPEAPEVEAAAAGGAGLEVTDLRTELLRVEFVDIGAVAYFLRKVVWTVPDFSVDRYRDRLRDLHRHIDEQGAFVSHSSRTLIDARKPG